MSLASRSKLSFILGALTCAALLLSPLTVGIPEVSGPPAAAATLPACSAAQTYVWAAVEGGETAGTTYYELEFSNVGSTTCTLHGYPSVWAVSVGGARIGEPATHQGAPSTVTLAPGATSHAVLGVADTGAVCDSQGVKAQGLRVVPPGQTLPKSPGERDEVENFPLEVCAHQPSMHVDPVHSGVGIPNYTVS
jgi:hypothetical protein